MQQVFVWTLTDVMGLIALAAVVLAMLVVGVVEMIQSVRSWWRRKNR